MVVVLNNVICIKLNLFVFNKKYNFDWVSIFYRKNAVFEEVLEWNKCIHWMEYVYLLLNLLSNLQFAIVKQVYNDLNIYC